MWVHIGETRMERPPRMWAGWTLWALMMLVGIGCLFMLNERMKPRPIMAEYGYSNESIEAENSVSP